MLIPIPVAGTIIGAAVGALTGLVINQWDNIKTGLARFFFGDDAQYDKDGNITGYGSDYLTFWQTLKYKYTEFSDEAGLWVTTQFNDLSIWTSNALSKTGEWLGNAVSKTSEWLGNKFVAFSETRNGWLTKTGEAIGGAVFDAVQGVRGMWNDSTEWLQTKITDSIKILDETWQEIQREGLGAWMQRKIGESLSEFGRSISEVCTTFSNTIGSGEWWAKIASQWWEDTKSGAGQLWEDTKSGAKQLGDNVSNAAGQVWEYRDWETDRKSVV